MLVAKSVLANMNLEASEAVVGNSLATSIKLPGKDEYSFVSDYELQTYIENNLSPPLGARVM